MSHAHQTARGRRLAGWRMGRDQPASAKLLELEFDDLSRLFGCGLILPPPQCLDSSVGKDRMPAQYPGAFHLAGAVDDRFNADSAAKLVFYSNVRNYRLHSPYVLAALAGVLCAG
jgi:hypothetical protein